MKFIRFLTIVAATSFLAVSGVELTKVSSLHSGKKNASRALPSSSLNITKDSIFYSPTSDEVKAYYSTIKVGDKGDSFLTKLQTLLKNGQKKVIYSSGDSSSSTSWKGYYLYERDYSLSPLTATEVSTGKWKTSGIWVNSLYCKSPIYVETGINKGTFEYYTDWDVTSHSGSSTATATYSQGNVQIDREHVFPKSNGFNGSYTDSNGKTTNTLYEHLTAGCDAHNLRAGEHVGNSSAHSNIPYGNVANKDASTTAPYTSKITGECVGYVGLDKNGCEVYEPNDEDKGDIARACFYMIARYHNYEVDPNDSSYHTPALTLADKVTQLSGTKTPENTASSAIAYGELSDLLEWNEQDPVDDEEIRRNDLVYLGIQGNRNPFVDFPSWAKAAFNKSTVTFDDISIRKAYLGEETGGGSSSSSSSSTSSSSDPINNDEPEENIFTKFTSNDQLILGSKVTIVAAEYEKAIGTATTYYRNDANITKNDDASTLSDAQSATTLTLLPGLQDNSYCFKTEDGNYLSAVDGTYNNLVDNTSLDNYSSFSITLNDDGTATISALAGERNTIRYNKSSSRFSCYLSTSSTYVFPVCLYGYFEPDSFAKSEPTANLSFKFTDYTNEDGDYLMKDFKDVSMNIKLSYDFSERTDYTTAGAIIKVNGDESLYTGLNGTRVSIDSLSGNKMTWKDYNSSSYTVRINDIPSSAYNTNIMVVGYIQVDGLYHFTKPKTYSVISLLNAYTNSTETVSYNNENGTKTYVDVSDIARSFLDEINGGN